MRFTPIVIYIGAVVLNSKLIEVLMLILLLIILRFNAIVCT